MERRRRDGDVTWGRRAAWLVVYAVAMGWLEAAVVVYLRALFYPEGFTFPLAPMPMPLAVVEITREAATFVMILAVAVVASPDRWGAFLHFALVFGVWDIVYYAGLWTALGWPPTLLTPDVLLLIPVPWVGPVLAPILVSLLLIAGSVLLMRLRAGGAEVRFRAAEWASAVAGGALVVLSFTLDFQAVLEGGAAPPFRWGLFGCGVVLGAGAVVAGVRRFRGMMRRR